MNLTTSSTDHVVGGDVDPTFAELTSDKITKNIWFHPDNTLESFRFWDDDDFEYEIFSVLSIAHAWTSVILEGKRGSRRHSATSFRENVGVAGTSYQMQEVLLFCYREMLRTSFSINKHTNLFSEKSKIKLSRVSFFLELAQKL